MPKIALLTPQVANMIAAGEVVERPASVVKELVENSIDAGSRHITVEIKNGGITYMRVTDDGCGINASDVGTAFLRHATSKITRAEDLESINTMGFRGEALAALAAVAKVDMFTKPHDADMGRHISIEGGDVISETETGCADGTNIIVRDLFYNVPARYKFLKKDSTEAAKVEEAVVNAAIAKPDISFTFIKDGRDTFSTNGNGKIKDVIYAAYGREVTEDLTFITTERNGVTLKGYIGKPGLNRANRNLQSFYINSRPVKAKTLTVAMDEAYKNRLMTGRFAVYFLMIEMPPSSFDVNIHPQKLEVKFNYEREVFVLVRDAARAALDSLDIPDAAVPHERKPIFKQNEGLSAVKTSNKPYIYQTRLDEDSVLHDKNFTVHRAAFTVNTSDTPSAQTGSKWTSPVFKKAFQKVSEPEPEYKAETDTPQSSSPSIENASEPAPQSEPVKEEKVNLNDVKIIGEFYRTYVIAEHGGSIWLIDKHAAHERFLYNKLISSSPGAMAQYLLKPVNVALSGSEKDALLSNPDILEKAGFEISDAGGLGVLVRTVPSYIDEDEISGTVSEIAEKIIDNKASETDKLDELYKSIACKGAIKAGMKNDLRELQQLVIHTLVRDDMRTCPHGRPVVLEITQAVLEKMFKRTL